MTACAGGLDMIAIPGDTSPAPSPASSPTRPPSAWSTARPPGRARHPRPPARRRATRSTSAAVRLRARHARQPCQNDDFIRRGDDRSRAAAQPEKLSFCCNTPMRTCAWGYFGWFTAMCAAPPAPVTARRRRYRGRKRSRRPRPCHVSSPSPAARRSHRRPPRARQMRAAATTRIRSAAPIMPQPKLPSARRRFSPSSRYSRTPTASMTSARA